MPHSKVSPSPVRDTKSLDPAPPAELLLAALLGQGWHEFAGVPCSYFARLLEAIDGSDEATWIPAVREDIAIGMATGMALAGNRCSVLMQNSGLGYSLNILTSLNLVYEIGVLLIVSWRGHGPDAPEHEVMGRQLGPILDAASIEWRVLNTADPAPDVREAVEAVTRGQTTALVIGAPL